METMQKLLLMSKQWGHKRQTVITVGVRKIISGTKVFPTKIKHISFASRILRSYFLSIFPLVPWAETLIDFNLIDSQSNWNKASDKKIHQKH